MWPSPLSLPCSAFAQGLDLSGGSSTSCDLRGPRVLAGPWAVLWVLCLCSGCCIQALGAGSMLFSCSEAVCQALDSAHGQHTLRCDAQLQEAFAWLCTGVGPLTQPGSRVGALSRAGVGYSSWPKHPELVSSSLFLPVQGQAQPLPRSAAT